MEKGIEQLIKDVQSDEKLLNEFREAKLKKDDYDGIVSFAKEHGYSITAEDVKGLESRELTEDELELVAGGEMSSWGATCFMYMYVAAVAEIF